MHKSLSANLIYLLKVGLIKPIIQWVAITLGPVVIFCKYLVSMSFQAKRKITVQFKACTFIHKVLIKNKLKNCNILNIYWLL